MLEKWESVAELMSSISADAKRFLQFRCQVGALLLLCDFSLAVRQSVLRVCEAGSVPRQFAGLFSGRAAALSDWEVGAQIGAQFRCLHFLDPLETDSGRVLLVVSCLLMCIFASWLVS